MTLNFEHVLTESAMKIPLVQLGNIVVTKDDVVTDAVKENALKA